MANSPSDTGFTKCLSGAVRQLLCTGSLPTHPSDQVPEMRTTVDLINPCKDSVGASPGIVARLMGLDSVPEGTNQIPRATALNSITRSMSLNFMDYFPEIDRTHGGNHRRVRTSVSFREVPTSQHQHQNHDSFILFLENVDEAGEMGRRDTMKSETGFGELKQNKTERISKSRSKDNSKQKPLVKKNFSQIHQEENNKREESKRNIEPQKRVSAKHSSKVGTCYGVEDSTSVFLNQKKKEKDVPATPTPTPKVKNPEREASVGSKLGKKKKKEDDPYQFGSETSSRVSVSDHKGHPSPSGGHSMKKGSKRKKSSSTKTANWDYPTPNLIRESNTNDQERRTKSKRWEKKQAQKDYYIEMLSKKICELTEEDMKKSNWEAKKASKREYFEEICTEFEQQILSILLHQVVNELEE